MKMEIIFATSNLHKLEEAQGVVGNKIRFVTPSQIGINHDIPEEGETLKENALFKAEFLFKITGKNCFADDTGLEVESLKGAPGVKSARYASNECDSRLNMQKLLKELKGSINRRARFRTVIALILDGKQYFFEGTLNGIITENQSGKGGFGYDPLFLPNGYTKTLAELTDFQKNLISHRGIAIRNLSKFLENYNRE
ncbi:MAG: RdgB/HAM1 family non-canonical purine NTP pyrophosphatase [Bacteroidales bacterium]